MPRYIDDIIVFSEEWEQYCQHLWAVFAELHRNRLTANPKKCSLEKRETQYLGFIVSQGKIRVVADKVEVI